MGELKFWIVSLVIAICYLIGIWTFLSLKSRVDRLLMKFSVFGIGGITKAKRTMRCQTGPLLFILFPLFDLCGCRVFDKFDSIHSCVRTFRCVTVYFEDSCGQNRRCYRIPHVWSCVYTYSRILSGIWIIDRVFRLRWGVRGRLVEFPVSRCLIGCDVILLDCLGGRFCNRIR